MEVWMRVIALPSVAGQGAVVAVRVARGVKATGAVEQRQAIGQFVMEVVAALRQDGATVTVATMHGAVDVGGAGQRRVLQDVAVHLRRLVKVAWGVVL